MVHRGDASPSLYGCYVFADNNASTVYSLDLVDPGAGHRILDNAGQLGQQGDHSRVRRPDDSIRVTVLGSKEERTGRILQLVLEGGPAVGKSPDMPAWRGVFDEQELDALVELIRSFGR